MLSNIPSYCPSVEIFSNRKNSFMRQKCRFRGMVDTTRIWCFFIDLSFVTTFEKMLNLKKNGVLHARYIIVLKAIHHVLPKNYYIVCQNSPPEVSQLDKEWAISGFVCPWNWWSSWQGLPYTTIFSEIPNNYKCVCLTSSRTYGLFRGHLL